MLQKHVNAATDFEGFPCSKSAVEKLRCCYNQPALLQTLSYQAIMDAFTQSINVVIYMDGLKPDGVWMGSANSFYSDSGIMQTTLAQSEDLGYLRKALRSQPRQDGALTFQAAIAANESGVLVPRNGTELDFVGVSNSNAADSGSEMLSEMIEDLFMNLTISLMRSSALQLVSIPSDLGLKNKS